MASLQDVKIHVRKSRQTVSRSDTNGASNSQVVVMVTDFKHCFIAEKIASYSDISQAIYKRFGKDLKIRKIHYKDADGDDIDVVNEDDFAIMARKNTFKALYVTIDDVFGKVTL